MTRLPGVNGAAAAEDAANTNAATAANATRRKSIQNAFLRGVEVEVGRITAPRTSVNYYLRSLDAGDPDDFLKRGDAFRQLAQCRLTKSAHASLDGHVLDLEEVF